MYSAAASGLGLCFYVESLLESLEASINSSFISGLYFHDLIRSRVNLSNTLGLIFSFSSGYLRVITSTDLECMRTFLFWFCSSGGRLLCQPDCFMTLLRGAALQVLLPSLTIFLPDSFQQFTLPYTSFGAFTLPIP